MKKSNLLCFLFLLLSTVVSGQREFKFRVWLKDKAKSDYALSQPLSLLSQRALDRRADQGIALDSTDLPVSAHYIAQLTSLGFSKVTTSRWLNTVVISTADSFSVYKIQNCTFVDSVKCVWKSPPTIKSFVERTDVLKSKNIKSAFANGYGYGLPQLSISNGFDLHQMGFKGEGKWIAVIDAGFLNSNQLAIYKEAQILGTKDFVTQGGDVYKGERHGQMVLSIMAAIDSTRFIGAAPRASYWLFRTEDGMSEYPVEEDYWTAAAEYADSIGVDLINSSLGYSTFDDPSMNYTQSQLDGKTAFVTKAAQMAANKGMLVVISAGNEGDRAWRKINFPADAKDVLAVGAIAIDERIAAFSSFGYSADGRVKPDVLAVGERTYLYDNNGVLSTSNGTSFSAPLMTGMLACVWQALPQCGNKELIEMVRQYSNRSSLPDTHYGFGVPNLLELVMAKNGVNYLSNNQPEIYFKNSKGNQLVIKKLPLIDSTYILAIYNEIGKKIQQSRITTSFEVEVDTRSLKSGMYIVCIIGEHKNFTKKLIK